MQDTANTARDRRQEVAAVSPEEVFLINLKHLMQAEQLTEAELARRTKIPQPTMHKLLRGTTEDPRVSTVQAIAHYFGISMDELYSPAPNFILKESEHFQVQSIPNISWTDCIKGKHYVDSLSPSNWNQWMVVEHIGKHLYCLTSKPAMEPKLNKGTLLIIDPMVIPKDGDTVVVHYPNTSEATLREIIIDGPNRCLTSIQDMPNKSQETLTPDIILLGNIIESRFGF